MKWNELGFAEKFLTGAGALAIILGVLKILVGLSFEVGFSF